MERQTGKTPEELMGPEFPSSVAYIWSAFASLNSGRSMGTSGPNPISFCEIKAWLELTNNPLSPRDIEAVKLLDDCYIRTHHG